MVKRVAAQQPAQGQPAPATDPEPVDRLDRVRAARRYIPAGRRPEWAYHALIEPDRGEDSALHRSRPSAASSSRPRVAESASPAPGRARTTTAQVAGSVASRDCICARSRRVGSRRNIDKMDNDMTATGPPAGRDHRTELSRPTQPVLVGQHRCATQQFRPTARRGPCGDGPRGSPGRPGCASAGGSRASWRAGGCWAERSACSRE